MATNGSFTAVVDPTISIKVTIEMPLCDWKHVLNQLRNNNLGAYEVGQVLRVIEKATSCFDATYHLEVEDEKVKEK